MRMVAMAIVVIAFLSACALPASQEDIGYSAEVSTSCMIKAAHDLDDQKSDAVAVAYGVLGACNRQLSQAVATVGQGFSYDNQQRVKRKLDESNLRTATAIVLKERSLRAQETDR
jgi:hypothetical protein